MSIIDSVEEEVDEDEESDDELEEEEDEDAVPIWGIFTESAKKLLAKMDIFAQIAFQRSNEELTQAITQPRGCRLMLNRKRVRDERIAEFKELLKTRKEDLLQLNYGTPTASKCGVCGEPATATDHWDGEQIVDVIICGACTMTLTRMMIVVNKM